MHSQHLQREIAIGGIDAEAHQGASNGDASKFHKMMKLLARVQAAATNIENGPTGFRHQAYDLVEQLACRGLREARNVSRKAQRWIPNRNGELLLDVLRDVDEHRTRAAASGEKESLFDDARDIIDVEDEVIVLGDGSSDFYDGGLLKSVGADHAAGYLAGDGNKGHRIKKGVSEARNKVGSARARGCDAHARAAGGAGISGGSEDLSLLVAEKVVGDGRGTGEGLMDLHGGTARVGKEVGDALSLERLNEDV